MLISRECDYAIRTLRALAGGGRLAVNQICLKENIPRPYCYKILKKLEKASLVNVKLGTDGGYRLAAPLTKVTIYDVYLAVEGAIFINECLRENYNCQNNPDGRGCAVHKALDGLQEQLAAMLKRHSLAEILALE